MTIQGLQTLTLLDFPGRIACTVFTGGCNFRCPFCHNASLVTGTADDISEERLFAFLESRKGRLDGVCITGGEPTLRPDLRGLIERIRDLGFAVKLDTNGARPEVLRDLMQDGLLDYVAMDIKNAPDKYAVTAGLTDDRLLDGVRESVSLLMNGSVEFEFRTTAVRELHTPEDFDQIGQWIKGAPQYFIQRFTDSGDLLSSGMTAPTEADMQAYLEAARRHLPTAQLRGM